MITIGIIPTNDLGFYNQKECKDLIDVIKTQLIDNTCLADVEGNRRKNENFIKTYFLQLDFDKVDIDPCKLSKSLPFKNWIMASKSDGKEGKRSFHLFVPLNNSIKSIPEYNQALKEIVSTYKFPFDEKAKDAVRFFWKHKDLLRGKIKKGIPFYEPSKYKPQPSRVPSKIPESSSGDIAKAVSDYESKHQRKFDLKTDGGRWKTFTSLLGVVRKMGFDTPDIKLYIDAIAKYETDADRAFTKEKVHRFIERH